MQIKTIKRLVNSRKNKNLILVKQIKKTSYFTGPDDITRYYLVDTNPRFHKGWFLARNHKNRRDGSIADFLLIYANYEASKSENVYNYMVLSKEEFDDLSKFLENNIDNMVHDDCEFIEKGGSK